jgi:hypothetical protein
MRNYVKCFVGFTFTPNPFPPPDANLSTGPTFLKTDDEVSAWLATVSAGDTSEIFPLFIGLQNKEDVLSLLASCFQGPLGFFQMLQFIRDNAANAPIVKNAIFYFETPRKIGLNAKTEKKGATSLETADFTGAEGLLEALAALPELAAKLTIAGELRQAGIVLYAYRQVIANLWSITEAFAYLRNQRIVGF